MGTSLWGLLRVFTQSPDWKFYHYLIVLRVVLLSFFTLIMISSGITEKQVLLCLALYLVVSYIYVYLLKRVYAAWSYGLKVISLLVMASLLFSYPSVSNYSQNLGALTFMLVVSILIGLSDLCVSDSNWAIQEEGKKIGFSHVVTLSLSSFVCAILIALAYPLFGYLADIDISIMIYTVAFFFVALVVLFKGGVANNVQEAPVGTSDAKPPVALYMQLILSPLYTTIAYLGRLYIFPLFFLEAARHYGFDKGAFQSLGLFFAVITVIALFSRRITNSFSLKPHVSMIWGYVIGVLCWTVIALLYQLEHTVFNSILAIVLYIVFDITTKFWNAGYMAGLSKLAKQSAYDEQSVSRLHRMYTTYHVQFSKFTIALGFFVFYFAYDSISPELLVLVFSALSLLYVAYYYLKCLRHPV